MFKRIGSWLWKIRQRSCRRRETLVTAKQQRTAWLLISGMAVCVTALPTIIFAQRELSAIPMLAEAEGFSDADFEEMLASIALYRDTLLANTLGAAVFIDDLRDAFALTGCGADGRCGHAGLVGPDGAEHRGVSRSRSDAR